MPLVFVGHGSPLNAIQDNEFSQGWEKLGQRLPRPEAILAISAHYYTRGTYLNDAEKPTQIYDMYGFPKELYDIKYEPPGDKSLAQEASKLTAGKLDHSFGIDHGVWSVLRRVFPKADIPIVEMSVDGTIAPKEMFDLGKKLKPLRSEGVLIFGTGSIVHNLSLVNWDMDGGYPWAVNFQSRVTKAVKEKDYSSLINYRKIQDAGKAFTTVDHYAPLLYVLGAADEKDKIEIFNDKQTLGSISMTSYLVG